MHFAAQGVMSGCYDIAIACGVESMTRAPMASNAQWRHRPVLAGLHGGVRRPAEDAVRGGADPGRRFKISREDMDEFALESHRRAAAAVDSRRTSTRELLPVPIKDADGQRDRPDARARRGHPPRDGTWRRWPRCRRRRQWDPTLAPDITAGNASQMSDGAAAMLIADRRDRRRARLAGARA